MLFLVQNEFSSEKLPSFSLLVIFLPLNSMGGKFWSLQGPVCSKFKNPLNLSSQTFVLRIFPAFYSQFLQFVHCKASSEKFRVILVLHAGSTEFLAFYVRPLSHSTQVNHLKILHIRPPHTPLLCAIGSYFSSVLRPFWPPKHKKILNDTTSSSHSKIKNLFSSSFGRWYVEGSFGVVLAWWQIKKHTKKCEEIL